MSKPCPGAAGIRFGWQSHADDSAAAIYVVQPMPGVTVVKQMVFDGALMLILGAIAAFMYRQTPRS